VYRRVLLAGMKLARRLLRTEPLRPYYDYEAFPGETVESDEDLLGGLTSVTSDPTFPARRDVIELYARLSGRDLSGLDWYSAFAYFKLAVICQQIFYRWKVGQTRDTRFAAHEAVACNLVRQAARVAELA